MRNLHVLQHAVGDFGVTAETSQVARASSIDAEQQVLYTVVDAVLTAYDLKTRQIVEQTPLDVDVPSCVCVQVQHLQLDQAVSVAFGHGDMLLCTLDGTASQRQIENVGCIDVGIAAMGWSPDQELVVVINCAGALLVLTREFDVLTEAPLETDEFGAAAPINVGWGKRETQFQGKAGKESIHKPKPQADVPADDSAPRIAWRGDGEYFVTSTKPDGGPRRLRVWDRHGVLQSTSEDMGGLEQSLAWRPSGNLIASTQRLPQRHDVVFFERNGLRHGEFALPFGPREMQVLELAWNCDSSVLAAWIVPLDTPPHGEPGAYVQLWTSSNYHWYLKQEYRFDSVKAVVWDPEAAQHLVVVTGAGTVHHYRHDMHVDCTVALHRSNHATVAVQDGARLLLTSFRSQCVPPPMCSESVDITTHTARRGCVRVVSLPPRHCHVFAQRGWLGRVPMAVITSTNTLAVLLTDAGCASPNRNDTTTQRDDTHTAPPTLVALVDLNAAADAHGYGPPPGQPHETVFVRQLCWTSTRAVSPSNTEMDGAAVAAAAAETDGHTMVSTMVGVAWIDGQDNVVDIAIEHGAGVSEDATMPARVVRFDATALPSAVVRLQGSDGGGVAGAPEAMVSLASGGILSCVRRGVDGPLDLVPWTRWQTEGVVSVSQTVRLAVVPMKASLSEWSNGGDNGEGMVDLSDDEAEDGENGDVDGNGTTTEPALELALVTLSSAGQLCLNGHLLVTNCNSFAVHDCFLLFATHTHACHFLSTRFTPAEVIATFGGTSLNKDIGFAERNLERGSRIVTVVPFGTRVVLQMPRGNLEVICPRPLLIVALQAFLDRRDYRRAFLLARKHRLNLNLLYDRNPLQFDEDLKLFPTALQDPTYINVFLSDLRDENHAATFDRGGSFAPPVPAPGKRDRICDALRTTMLESADKRHFLLSIVHAFICRSTPLYGQLLEYLRGIREQGGETNATDVDRALKYAAVVVKSADVLFDAALGTYDFDLVIMVAKVAQKDPKEYLAFLEELAELPDPVRKHRIDMHLKRYERALENLSQAGDDHFAECLQLVQDKKLYRAALRIYTALGDADKLKAMQSACAAHLRNSRAYREAGLMFQMCGEDEKALEAFLTGLEWRWALIMIAKLGTDDDQTHVMATSLTKQLEAAGRFSEAVVIATEYLGDPEYAVVLTISGQLWTEALRLILRHRRQDLVQTHLAPAVTAAAEQLCTGFGAGEGGLTATLRRHIDRLVVVRAQKIEQRGAGMQLDDDAGPQSDLYSDTSSRASTRTSRSRSSRSSKSGSSRKTHRSKRRDRAKQTSLREGGIFEEVALLDAIKRIADQADTAGKTASDLCSVLHYLGESALASRVESTLDVLHATLASCHDAVWRLDNVQATTLADPELVALANEAVAAKAEAQLQTSGRKGTAAAAPAHGNESAAINALVTDLRSVKIDDVSVEVPARPVSEDARQWHTSLLSALQH
eukprot:m.66950 g.66950  ORF g.66950 m.66950 type:complete len:1467 (-) comp8400_c0_seq1:13-4413(-)